MLFEHLLNIRTRYKQIQILNKFNFVYKQITHSFQNK
jgi:hypothetical protein